MKPALQAQQQRFLELNTPLPAALAAAGLVLVSHEFSSGLVADFVNFNYANASTGVNLEISISEVSVILVSVSRLPGEWFTLDDYLVFHGRVAEKKMNFHVSKNLESFFDSICTVVGGEWLDIFQGKRWEKIPHDWDGVMG